MVKKCDLLHHPYLQKTNGFLNEKKVKFNKKQQKKESTYNLKSGFEP